MQLQTLPAPCTATDYLGPCQPHAQRQMRAVASQVLLELTSKRVLTMTFEEGVGVNDLEGLAAIVADKKEVHRAGLPCCCQLQVPIQKPGEVSKGDLV